MSDDDGITLDEYLRQRKQRELGHESAIVALLRMGTPSSLEDWAYQAIWASCNPLEVSEVWRDTLGFLGWLDSLPTAA